MQEIENLYYKLLIQPLYVQFFVHTVVLSMLTSIINNVFFANTIPFGVKFFECVYYGAVVTVATTFKHRTSYGRLKKSTRLKYWTDFQRAIRTGQPPETGVSSSALTWFIRETESQSKRRRFYGPLMLMLGGATNVLIFSWQGEPYLLFFAVIMPMLGSILFYEAKRESNSTDALAIKQQQ